jgi:hypothetical protein
LSKILQIAMRNVIIATAKSSILYGNDPKKLSKILEGLKGKLWVGRGNVSSYTFNG